MDSRHLVDPELLPLLDVYQPLQPSLATLPAQREQRKAFVQATLATLPAGTDVVDKAEHLVPGPAGAPPVRVLVYTPRGHQAPLPAFMNIHGGGLVAGLPEQDELSNRRIAATLGCVVVAPAYRLAPETPFPGPLADCRAALDWLVASAASLGLDPTRIALGGSSAGGGLAAALALQVRDSGTIRLAFLYLVFPMLDDRTGSTREPSAHAGQFIWTATLNRFGWAAYLGCEPGAATLPDYAAPARTQSLAGLPPTWIGCGALDLFLDENLDFARRLIHAGVPTEMHIYPGAFHAFQWAANAQVTQSFARDSLQALARAFARTI